MALRSDASTGTTTTSTSTTLLWSRGSSGGRRIVHLVVVAMVCMIGVTSISLLLSKSMNDFKSYYSSHSKKYPQHGSSSSRGFDRDLNQRQNVKLSATIKRSSLTFTHDQMEEMRFKRYFKNYPKTIRTVENNDHHGRRDLQSSEAKEPFVTSASFIANSTTNESSLVELSPSAGVSSNRNVSSSAATAAATAITTGTSPNETPVVNTTSTLDNNKNNTNQDVPAGNGATSSTSTTTTDIHKNSTNTTSSPSSTNSKINTTTTTNDENETTTTTVAAVGGAPPTNEEQKQQQINKQQQNTEDELFHWWVKVKPNNSCSQPPPPTRRSHSATVAKYFLTQPSSSSTAAAATPTRLSPVPPRNQILDDVSSNSTTTVENKDNVDDDVTQEQSPDGKKNDRRRRANRSLVVGTNETNNNDSTPDGGGGISQHEQQVAKNDKARAVARSICLEYPDYHNVQEYMIVSGGFTDDDWTTFPVYAFDLTSTHHLQSQEKSCDASASSLWEDEARKSMDESDRHLPIPSGRWYYLGNGGQDTSSSRRRTRSKHDTSRNLRAGDTSSIMTDTAHTTSDSTTKKRISTTARRETLEDEGSSTTAQEEMMAVVVEEEEKDGSHIEDEDIDLSSSSATTTTTTNDTNNQTETSTTTAQPTTTSTTSTTRPMGRVGHVSVVSPTTHELFVFGGLTYGHRTFHVADQETSSSLDENDGEPTTSSSSLPPVKLWKAKLPPSKDVWDNEADTSSENEDGDAADSSFSHSPSLSLEWEEVTPRVAARFVEEQTLIARGEAAGGLWIHPHTKEEYMIFYGGLRKSSSSYSSSTTSTSWSSSSYGTGLDMPLGDVWAYSLQNNLLEQWASYPPVLEQQASYNYYPRNKKNDNEEQTTDEGDNKSNQSPSTLLPPDPLLSDYDAIYNDEYYFGNDYPSMMGGGAGISYPIARTAHAATVTSNKLITYGGMALSTMTGATTESGIGGIGGSSSSSSWVPPSWQMLDDIWEFDLLKRQWIGKRQMYPPLARSYHSIGGMGGTLVSTGGFRASDTFAGEQVAFVFADTLISLDPSATSSSEGSSPGNNYPLDDKTAGDDTNEEEMEQQQHHHHEGKFDDYENGLMLNELIRESVVEFWQKAVSPTTKEADGIPHRLEHSSVIDSYGSLYVWGGRFRYVNQITSDVYRLDILNPGTLPSDSSVGSIPSPGSPLWSPLAARDVWNGRGQIRSEISTEIAEPDGMDEYEAELQTLHLIVAIMIFMSVLFTTMLGSLRRQVDEANQNAMAAANGGAFATLDGARFGMMDFMATNGGGIGIGSSNSNLNRRGGVRQDVIDTFPIKLFQPEPVASSTLDHVEMTCMTTGTNNTRTNHSTTNNNDDESVLPVNSSINNNHNEETETVSSTQTQVVSSSIEERVVAPSNNYSNIPPPDAFTTTTVTDPTATATTTTALSLGAQEEGTTTLVLPPPPSSCLVDTTSSENYLFSEDDYELPACVICLVEYEMGDEMRILPCQHEFHKDCVDAWLYNHSSCPACRHSLAHTTTAPTAAAAAQQEDADSSSTSSSQFHYDTSPTAAVDNTIMPHTESTTTTTHRTIVSDHDDDDDIDNDPASRQVRPRLLTQLWNRTRANVTSYPGRQQQRRRRRRQGRSIYGGVFRLSDNVVPPSAVEEEDDPNDNNNNTRQNQIINNSTAINTATVVVEEMDDTLQQVEMINYRGGSTSSSSGGTATSIRTAVPSSDAFIL